MMWIEKQYDEGDDQKYKTWQIDIWLFFFLPKNSFENDSNNHNGMLWYDDDMMLIWYDEDCGC